MGKIFDSSEPTMKNLLRISVEYLMFMPMQSIRPMSMSVIYFRMQMFVAMRFLNPFQMHMQMVQIIVAVHVRMGYSSMGMGVLMPFVNDQPSA
jgi:hypothetical protein